jgi:hypothetical protein
MIYDVVIAVANLAAIMTGRTGAQVEIVGRIPGADVRGLGGPGT